LADHLKTTASQNSIEDTPKATPLLQQM